MEDVVLLDTGIIFDFFIDGPFAPYTERILNEGKASISAVTVYELFRGVKNGKHIDQRTRLLAYVHKLELTSEIAVNAGRLYTNLRSSGLTIDNEDILIAATAMNYNIELFTSNKKHFENINGIRLFNPEGLNL